MSPPLTGVFASIPGGVNEETVPDKYKDYFFSKQQNANAPILSAESVKFLHTLYQSDQASPLAFPIAFPDHTGVPKTYFQVCGFDPLRDCGLVFEQVYKDAGVPTKLDVYPGMPHAFWAILPHLELARKHTEDTTEGLRWLLAQ
ncbi:Fc.00g065290.m01.CDS01 [Cosmosporella sp. VM-42]